MIQPASQPGLYDSPSYHLALRTLETGDEEGEDHPGMASSHLRTSQPNNKVQQHREQPFCVASGTGPASAAKELQ